MAAKKIMVQGTMSNSGKSFLVAALCRIFRQDGYRAAPFKSQNMALNSYITKDGLEIGRAQAMQAEAAGIDPTVDMNPILLKPTSQMGSQVIVNGEVAGNWKAMDYYRQKTKFIPVIQEAFSRLEEQYDIIVLEGAGSPAEINLKEHDIVNMGMAKMAGAPVLLVGDIDRGGVFASLYGTVALLEPEEQNRIKGLVINKFRGDPKILDPGLRMIEDLVHIPVVGVIPMETIDLDDEDSLSERLTSVEKKLEEKTERKLEQNSEQNPEQKPEQKLEQKGDMALEDLAEETLDIAVIRLPHISNFTDFNNLERRISVSLRYVERADRLGRPDLVILPGTKNTMADLIWLRESGLEPALIRLVEESQIPLIGICGGYQMLGAWLRDPGGVEGAAGGVMRGMGLLPAETVFTEKKTRTQIGGILCSLSKLFSGYEGQPVTGYEIHMGITTQFKQEPEGKGGIPAIALEDGRSDGMEREDGLVFGSYLHGLFDNEALTDTLLGRLAAKKGICPSRQMESLAEYKERQYDRLADLVRKSLDMDQIYKIMEQAGE